MLQIQFLILLLLGLGSQACSTWTAADMEAVEPPSDFKQLLIDIREMKISPDSAKQTFKKIIGQLRADYPPIKQDHENSQLVFPLAGRNYKAVGGNGTGFYIRQFDLFDHTVSGSHPAHDIFIYDLNRDSKDDRDNAYVDIVSVCDGIVIASEKEWSGDLDYKGGNYVWVYDFETGGLWYYAHQRKVVVQAGQRVSKGDKLGEVGRTGFNAATNRSDTHLHLMYLQVSDDLLPMPVDHYPWLKEAQTIRNATMAEPLQQSRIKWPIDLKILPILKPKALLTQFPLFLF